VVRRAGTVNRFDKDAWPSSVTATATEDGQGLSREVKKVSSMDEAVVVLAGNSTSRLLSASRVLHATALDAVEHAGSIEWSGEEGQPMTISWMQRE